MVEFYEGADKLNVGNTNTQPDAPSGKRDGGPVETFEGGNQGSSHSKTYPSWDNTGSVPKPGNTVKGPMDV